MNYAQMGCFLIYLGSIFAAGCGVIVFLKERDALSRNRLLFLGEVLLLGGILLVGEMITLSLIGLYNGWLLWGCVLLNYLFLVNPSARRTALELIATKPKWDLPLVVFGLLLLAFTFRNMYFLSDVDSHSTYLFVQKLWLQKGTSIFFERGIDMRTFVSHFECVPYALGISLFGKETLFCQLVNWSWRVMALLLVFGYTSYRWNNYYALAATCLILFNFHFFFSGINHFVYMNGAVIAFVFASAYNLWEAQKQKSPYRFLVALIFLSQLMANKYQMAYILIGMGAVGIFLQDDPLATVKAILRKKSWLIVLGLCTFFGVFWFLKNGLATGNPVFPIMASKSGIDGFHPEMDTAFLKVFGGVRPNIFIKYMNYLFIWPGMLAAKYVILTISFLPFIYLLAARKREVDQKALFELFYWLGLSFICMMGIAVASHQDPRYYRYGFGVLAFAAVFALRFIMMQSFRIPKEAVVIALILLLSMPKVKVLFDQGGSFRTATVEDNIGVLLNRLHMDDAIRRHYPNQFFVLEQFEENRERALRSGWDEGFGGRTWLSAFLLPVRPQVGLWYTTVVEWESYEREDLIARDVRDFGLQWVMNGEEDRLVFLSPEEYAKKAVTYERFPKKIFYPYNLPPELSETNFKK